VNLCFHLAGLSAQETRAYIQHHLQVAGVKHALFCEEAIAVIYHFSKGIPRKSTTSAPPVFSTGSCRKNRSSTRLRPGAPWEKFEDDV